MPWGGRRLGAAHLVCACSEVAGQHCRRAVLSLQHASKDRLADLSMGQLVHRGCLPQGGTPRLKQGAGLAAAALRNLVLGSRSEVRAATCGYCSGCLAQLQVEAFLVPLRSSRLSRRIKYSPPWSKGLLDATGMSDELAEVRVYQQADRHHHPQGNSSMLYLHRYRIVNIFSPTTVPAIVPEMQ